ncbi:hypothetical protein HHK36_020104 [Tetracentron sinense]|uniref:KAT8 regulatory NSL complex subunit 2 n=1 Tax=Tetracentron sinense TaxID=13715 RepID=A0A835DBB5_TETSI|nr:hypothetical protein HHK36_020104 [Tetracentron sinense]
MAPANKHFPTTSKLPKRDSPFPLRNPSTSNDTEEKNPNPNPNHKSFHLGESDTAEKVSVAMGGSEEDSLLSKSEFLTRQELIRRRSRLVKQLTKCYKNHYWALMEELKVQHRDYYWKYGTSPFEKEEETENGVVEGSGENNDSSNNNGNRLGLGLGLGFGDNRNVNNRCAFAGCKSKAMALAKFCHSHILSDTKQKLYTACTYFLKSLNTGPVYCGKPILRSTVPSLCTVHFQKGQKHVTLALKKAGLNISSSSKVAPKFHVIIAESVRQIQAKRRAARRATVKNIVVKEEITG